MSKPNSRAKRAKHEHISLEAIRVFFGRIIIAFRPEFASLGIGTQYGPLGTKGAVFLSQGFYWSENESDENGFWRKTQKEIHALTGLNGEEQLTVRAELQRRGYLSEETFGVEVTDADGRTFTGPGRLHYKLELSAIHGHLETLVAAWPHWIASGDLSVEDEKERKRRRNADDRRRRREAREAKAEIARLAESEKRVSGFPGYALSPAETANSEEMRIRETPIRAPGKTLNTHPEKSDSLYIEEFGDASGQKHNGENDDFDRAFDDDAAGNEMRVVVDVSNSQNDADAETDLANRLIAEGVSIDAARQFAREKSEIAERQLKYLPYRPEKPANAGGNRGGLLAASIRADYPPPGAFLDQQRAAAEREKNRPALEARQAASAARDAEQVAANESAAQLFARLDAVWENLDADDRALVEKTALKSDEGKNFVADRIRERGEIPLLERRAAVEILLDEGLLTDDDLAAAPEAAPTPQNAPPLRAEAPTAPAIETPAPMAAHPADLLWNALDDMAKRNIATQIEQRLAGAPESEKTEAARVELRRALIVDFIARATSGTNENEVGETGELQPKTA